MKQLHQKHIKATFFYFSFCLTLIFSMFWFAGTPVEASEATNQPVGKADVFKAEVFKVIDGDTIRLKDGTLIRYLGIDTPELRRKVDNRWVYDPEPFAEEAAEYNKKMVEGKEVLIETDPVQKHDKFGRLLAYIYIDRVLVNEELLKQGLAKTKTPSLFMKHRIRFWSLEEMAWTSKRGLWANEDMVR